MSLPGLPIEFTKPPRLCPVCGMNRWRDVLRRVHRPALHEPGTFEAEYIAVGQVCATCDEQQRGRVPRTMDTARDADPDAGNINHGY